MVASTKSSRHLHAEDAASEDMAVTNRTREELRFWIDAVGAPILVVDHRDLTARSGNRAAERLFGLSAQAIAGATLRALVGMEANQMLEQIWSNAPIGVTGEPFLVRAVIQGTEWLLMVQVSKVLVEGEVLRLFSFADAPPEGSVALAGWQEKMIDMLNWLPFGFEIASADEQIQFANSHFNTLFGYTQDEVASIDDWWRLAYPDPKYREFAKSTWETEMAKARAEDREMTPFDMDVMTRYGITRTIQFRHRTIDNFNVNLYLDVTDERAATRELKRLSEIDPLTSLMNRRRFFDEANVHFERDAATVPAILVLDLDKFKAINDRYGHAAGDSVLQEFARRCEALIDGHGCIARFGGEEFVVLVREGGERAALAIAEQLRLTIASRPFALPQGPISVTVSIGVAAKGHDEELSQTISRADTALYRAKRGGRNRVERAFPTQETPR